MPPFNDLDENLEVLLSKFTDNSKFGKAVDSSEDRETGTNQRCGQSPAVRSLAKASDRFCTWGGTTWMHGQSGE